MLYYGFLDVLKAAGYSVFFGLLFCIVSVAYDTFFISLKNIFGIPKDVLYFSKNKKAVTSYFKSKAVFEKGGTTVFITDILFCITVGFLMSLLFYVTSDGEVRLYVLLIAFVSYKIFKKTLGNAIFRALLFLSQLCVKGFALCLIFLLFPIRSLLAFSYKRSCLLLKKLPTVKRLKSKNRQEG